MLKEVFLMKIFGNELENKTVEALESCLSKVPFLKIGDIVREPSKEEAKPDLLVKIDLPDGEKYLVVEIKGNGQPRIAREAVNQLLRYRDLLPDAYGVFVAPYISPKSAEICTREEMGYLDLAGNCRLCFGKVYIEQEGKPNVFAKKRDLRSLYSPKAERILRVLLNNSKRKWKTKELADEAQVSLGQVSNVKKLLMDREWAKTEKSGFLLSEPEQLLKEWAENYSFRRNRVIDYYSLKSVVEVEADIAKLCNRKGLLYAFTGFSGAARLAPTVRYQRVFAYVEETEEDISSLLGFKRVSSGANVSLLFPYDVGVFYGRRELEGTQIASPIQIYLDVFGFRGRGEEAAGALLKQVILTQW